MEENAIFISSNIQIKNGKVTFKTLNKSKNFNKIELLKHEDLMSELKFLYTAVTRARLRLIVFDNPKENMQEIFSIFNSFNLFHELLSEKDIEEFVRNSNF